MANLKQGDLVSIQYPNDGGQDTGVVSRDQQPGDDVAVLLDGSEEHVFVKQRLVRKLS